MNLHHVDPATDYSETGIMLEEAKDVINAKSRMIDDIINRATVIGASDTYMAEDTDSQDYYGLRERTFTDSNLTTLAMVQIKANSLIAQYKAPLREIPIKLPEFFIIDIRNRIYVTCPRANLNATLVDVKEVVYSYSPSGLRTDIQSTLAAIQQQGPYTAGGRGFRISDILVDHDRRLSGI